MAKKDNTKIYIFLLIFLIFALGTGVGYHLWKSTPYNRLETLCEKDYNCNDNASLEKCIQMQVYAANSISIIIEDLQKNKNPENEQDMIEMGMCADKNESELTDYMKILECYMTNEFSKISQNILNKGE